MIPRWILAIALVAVACGPAGPAPATGSPTGRPTATPPSPPATATARSTRPFALTSNQAFIATLDCGREQCALQLDVLAPRGSGDVPMIVLLPGAPAGPGHRAAMVDLAIALAERELVVILADYRAIGTGGGYPQSLDDIACAVGYARTHAREFGGDPERLLLVGHSLGGTVALVSTLGHWSGFGGAACVAPASARPEAVVTIGGDVRADPNNPNFVELLGGTPAQMPIAWAAFDAAALVDASDAGLVLRQIIGSGEDEAIRLGAMELQVTLEAAGIDAVVEPVEGASHRTVVDPAGGGARTVEILVELANGLAASD